MKSSGVECVYKYVCVWGSWLGLRCDREVREREKGKGKGKKRKGTIEMSFFGQSWESGTQIRLFL